jgi:hypothetical protein
MTFSLDAKTGSWLGTKPVAGGSSAATARDEPKESVPALVVLMIIPLSDLLRVGRRVARPTVDRHWRDGLQAWLTRHSRVRLLEGVPVMHSGGGGERVAPLLRLPTGCGKRGRCGDADDGLIRCIGEGRSGFPLFPVEDQKMKRER